VKLGNVEDMKKAEVKPDEELTRAVKTLEQITDEWIEQQAGRFENTIATFHKKRISDCDVLKTFKNTMYKRRRFDNILEKFRLFILNIPESLMKKIWNILVCSIEFMQKVERYRDKADKKP